MNPTIPHQPRTGCPELERLAAFVDGKLSGAERTELIAHLADCDACREIVAESAALRAELESGGAAARPAEVVSFPRRSRGRARVIGVAATILLAASASLLFDRFGRDQTAVALAALAADPTTNAALAEGWSEPHWSVMRGEGPVVSERARAFRLGARAAALQVALGAGDRVAARRLAAESALLLSDVPLADPVAHVYRTIAQQLAAEGAQTGGQVDEALLGAELAREAVDPDLWQLGRWAETGRLVGATGSGIAMPRPPRIAEEATGELEPVLQSLKRRSRRSNGQGELAAEFERLLATGGDLR